MSNEITVFVNATLANGSFIKDSQNLGNVNITQAGKTIFQDVLPLTTSYAAIQKGSVGSLGLIFINNVNATGTIQVSVDGGTTSLLTIPAGATALLPMTAAYTVTDIQIKITASTGFAHYKIWEA
jgi:hypothetical protein